MNENQKSQFVGTGKTNNRIRTTHPENKNESNLEKENLSTIMQALLGCRKNCQECKEEEADYEKPLISCFYNRPSSPCSFTTSESQAMEKHYKKEHYLKGKEVFRA
jgi:hypothetical protein